LGSESSGLEQAAGDVVGEVSEAECAAAEVFEATVDRFGRAVAGAGPVEVGKHVGGSLFQGSAEGSEFDERGRDAAAEAGDELLHQAMATGRVGFAVGGDHSLVGGPGDFDGDVVIVGEQGIKPVLLLVGEQARAGVEGPARRVERVACPAAVAWRSCWNWEA